MRTFHQKPDPRPKSWRMGYISMNLVSSVHTHFAREWATRSRNDYMYKLIMSLCSMWLVLNCYALLCILSRSIQAYQFFWLGENIFFNGKHTLGISIQQKQTGPALSFVLAIFLAPPALFAYSLLTCFLYCRYTCSASSPMACWWTEQSVTTQNFKRLPCPVCQQIWYPVLQTATTYIVLSN